ncbi:hypothetical protein [Bulleidia extructa]|uniref:hypothetical protein n=1 Tax=Bulleidia extructa TaxID=118748 RepID=UPI0023565D94|nr:hypothetical protein [Bulleidia extructa]
MKELETFEPACQYLIGIMSEFKDVLESKVEALQQIEWIYHKGTVKVCRPDDKGRKKRCKVGMDYWSKIILSADDANTIWNEFRTFFAKSYLVKMDRIELNEEIGQYEFIAKGLMGDEVECRIYTPNEWNIPQIRISGFVSSKYRSMDQD